MSRVTDKDITNLISRVNAQFAMNDEPYTRCQDGRFICHVGNFHFYKALGVRAMNRMSNDKGGVERVLTARTNRDLYELIYAYLSGARDMLKSERD